MLFGEYIKQLRESRGLSLSEGAAKLGITRQKLWDIENGRRSNKKVPESLLKKISQVYNLPFGLIVESTRIKVSSTKTVSELLAQSKPLLERANVLTVALCNESRAYTPELEGLANELYEVLSQLKTVVGNAYDSMYPNTQYPSVPNGKEKET
jgi:transcriptional regulator with XRE-family HTH domain